MFSLDNPPKTIKAIEDQAFRQKLPLPEKLLNAPQVAIGLELYYIGFSELTTCRYTPDSPISWVVIEQYCQAKGIEGRQKADFFALMYKLDKAYLEHRSSKIEKGASDGLK